MPPVSLPHHFSLNVHAFSRLLDNTTNSYKFLFIQAVLKKIQRQAFTERAITYAELLSLMLETAWYPHTYFHLSFGPQDQIAKVLKLIQLNPDACVSTQDLNSEISVIVVKPEAQQLLRFVPYRLLTEFFKTELRGVADWKINKEVKRLANENYEGTNPPLYRFCDNSEAIEIHPDWMDYLKQNFRIISHWARWNWLCYLQRRNPSAPSLATKLEPPLQRQSLALQTDYWQNVLNEQELYCIYTRTRLSPDNMALDHFLPWSFVGHDSLWNLIPVHPLANSSKGNRLPKMDIYFDNFIDVQRIGLMVSQQIFNQDRWLKRVESFITDLHISDLKDLMKPEVIKEAYTQTVTPLMQIARISGFCPDWVYTR